MAIWFQGCEINCDNCCNPQLQELKTVHIVSIETLINIAQESKLNNGIEGITLLGGEPTLQKNLNILLLGK